MTIPTLHPPTRNHSLPNYKYSVLEFAELIDSSSMDGSHWKQIQKCLAYNWENFDAFVVLHGTDTLAYTASALSFILEDLGKTVVCVPKRRHGPTLMNTHRLLPVLRSPCRSCATMLWTTYWGHWFSLATTSSPVLFCALLLALRCLSDCMDQNAASTSITHCTGATEYQSSRLTT